MKKTDGKTTPRQEEHLNIKPILNDEKFTFKCYPGISCFNECCHQIDVILTPFDVLRMKNQLGITSDQFLTKYTHLQKLKGTDIPLVKLKMQDENDKRDHCVFLTGEGCLIYDNRPAVCRNYPTGIATQDPKEGDSNNPYFILTEDMCKGHFEKEEWTVETWKKNQGVEELDDLNRPWLEIVAKLKNLSLKDDKDQKMNLFLMVCFDLDTFRKMVFESTFLTRFDIPPETVQLIENNEDELLNFGFKWLQFVLFKEGPIKPKE
jgi:hypothetical protein